MSFWVFFCQFPKATFTFAYLNSVNLYSFTNDNTFSFSHTLCGLKTSKESILCQRLELFKFKINKSRRSFQLEHFTMAFKTLTRNEQSIILRYVDN